MMENMASYNKDQELYEQKQLEYEVIKIFNDNIFIERNYYIFCFFLVLLSIFLTTLIIQEIVSVFFVLLLFVVIAIVISSDNILDGKLSKPINEQYLNKVVKKIKEQMLYKDSIYLKHGYDRYYQDVNACIRKVLKKDNNSVIRYKDIVELYKKYKKEFELIKKKIQNENDKKVQSKFLEKYLNNL